MQAKRYTNIVTPDAVRALKGSMDEKNAIRGILVTTSDFGPASKEYAGQHNITLINGEMLVQLCRENGLNYMIDLKQAKEINKLK